MVGNWHADVVGIEDPVAGAFQADLLIPIPAGTADIGNLLDGGENTSTLNEVVSHIAGETLSIGIEGVALIGNRHTDSIVVKHPVARALEASLLVPVPGGTADI